ncbi:MAG TPA: HupE/UreJ family protein [Stellaceae bacterium]|nr:HupE/UreJ family protein [Stellaceae bacterium]
MRPLLGKALTIALLVLATMSPALAHKSSDSYLSVSIEGKTVNGQWDIALRDLDYAIGLDSNNDGIITWGELRAHQPAIADYALSHLRIASDGEACEAHASDHLIDNHSDGAYEVLRFSAACRSPPKLLEITYDLLFDFDPQHRGLLRLEEHGATHTAVFSPDQRNWRIRGEEVSWQRQVRDYLREGVWHIWTGYDHMLFLSALLLPAVLRRHARRWEAVANFGEAFRDVLKIVTAFTLAHSVTLSMAVLGYIAVPSRLVESAIALSVIAAALNNLFPLVEKRLWAVAFAFGLVHGLGFANVLAELGLPRDALAVSLVSFNLGVEVGQLAVVGGLLPLAYLWRRSWTYPRLVLGAGSLCIVAIASLWLIERSLNVRFLS